HTVALEQQGQKKCSGCQAAIQRNPGRTRQMNHAERLSAKDIYAQGLASRWRISTKPSPSLLDPLAQIRFSPERVAIIYFRYAGKVVWRWRQGHGPFQRPRPPRIAGRQIAFTGMQDHVQYEDAEADGLNEPAQAADQIQGVPTCIRAIRKYSTGHAQQAGQVHGQKGQVEANEYEPERGRSQA